MKARVLPARRFLPFSAGQRSCVGMNLAKVNLTACLASLLGNFSFRLADEVSLP
jgi:cytochrome P450 / NADPH-cytochrome P450 reductase